MEAVVSAIHSFFKIIYLQNSTGMEERVGGRERSSRDRRESKRARGRESNLSLVHSSNGHMARAGPD